MEQARWGRSNKGVGVDQAGGVEQAGEKALGSILGRGEWSRQGGSRACRVEFIGQRGVDQAWGVEQTWERRRSRKDRGAGIGIGV